MTRLEISSLARRDLREILEFISRDSRRNGERFIERLVAQCERLARSPELGNLLFDSHDTRYWSLRKYVIVYRVMERRIVILRVVHGARDWLVDFED